jgi:hypothetical protein
MKDKVEVYCAKCAKPMMVPRDLWEVANICPKGAVVAFYCCTVSQASRGFIPRTKIDRRDAQGGTPRQSRSKSSPAVGVTLRRTIGDGTARLPD